MATQFSKLLSNDTALKSRSKAIEEQARIALQSFVNEKSNAVSETTLKISDLLDFAAETTDSPRPGRPDWNAKKWATELGTLDVELEMAKIELKKAQERYEFLFGELSEE